MSEEDILSMPHARQVDYWLGRFCLAIGQGRLREEVYNCISFYQREAYERGQKTSKK